MIDRPFHRGDATHDQLMHQSVRELSPGWYDVTFTPKARGCTAARGYLHGVVVPIYGQMMSEFNGEKYADDETWEICKRQFRPREYCNRATGAVEVVGRSTKGMRPVELFAFTQLIIDWIQDNGGFVPAPDPNWRTARDRAMKDSQAAA